LERGRRQWRSRARRDRRLWRSRDRRDRDRRSGGAATAQIHASCGGAPEPDPAGAGSMELPLEVVAVAQGPGAIDGVDGEDVPRGAPAPEVAAPAAVAVPNVVVVGRVEGRGDGGAPAPEVAAEVGCTIVGVGGGIPALAVVATVAVPSVVGGGSAEGCRGAPAPNPVRRPRSCCYRRWQPRRQGPIPAAARTIGDPPGQCRISRLVYCIIG